MLGEVTRKMRSPPRVIVKLLNHVAQWMQELSRAILAAGLMANWCGPVNRGCRYCATFWRVQPNSLGAGLQCGWAIAMYTAAHPATVMIAAVAHPATVASGPLR